MPFTLRVTTCPWQNPALAETQTMDMVNFRKDATPEMKDRFQGMIQIVWSDTASFIRKCQENKNDKKTEGDSQWNCFQTMFEKMNELERISGN